MTPPDFSGETPAERLRALVDSAPGRIVFTTSFGLEDQALTHMIAADALPVELVTLDTGRLFPSTYRLWAETEARYGRRIRSVHSEPTALANFVADWGINGFYAAKAARLECCGIRKVAPLAHALAGASVWVTGLRADQSDGRQAVEPVAWDESRGLWKVAPLTDWSRDRVAAYCAAEAVPINSLHAEGYLSIGCEPCTRAVKPGEPERAGRWWWETDAGGECGLHVGDDGRLVRSAA